MFKDNNLSFEKYQSLKRSNELNKLRLHKVHIHESACRYALVDNLVNDFDWHYWIVITFGYSPNKSETERCLQDAHFRFDYWCKTNLKLSGLTLNERSEWVCIPEYGEDGHLHYNCFIKLNVRPDAKQYHTEWNAIHNAFKTTFKSIEKTHECQRIEFKLYERGRRKNALKMAIYSTKEMRTSRIEQTGKDNFANVLLSWKHFPVQPITRTSKKKLVPESSVTLDQFMQ